MNKASDVAKTALILILMVAVVAIMLFLLTGCFEATKQSRGDVRSVSIQADCDENTLDINLGQDMREDQKEATITK